MIHTVPTPHVNNAASRPLDVATIAVEPRTDRTPIIGHGTVRAKNQVNVVPEVNGRLTQVHPDLAQGKVIHKGELLFEIDPSVYEARVRQAKAEVQGLEAALEGHDQEQKNIEDRMANAEQMLEIDRRDYDTSVNLYEVDKVGSQRDLDMVHQKFLRQNDVMVELKNRLAMIPHLKQESRAQLEAAKARFDQAQHDLENTRILCPFEARVEAVQAYKSQVVTAHFSIATLTDMGAFEVSVGIDPRELRWLDRTIRPGAEHPAFDANGPEVKVSWAFQGQELTWRGRVSRFERVDEITRTARLVVEIRDVDMVATVVSGSSDVRPTLSIGMFCQTDLPAAELHDALFVPRHAIYDNRWVYVVEPSGDGDGRDGILARREVTLLRSVHDDVLVNYADRAGSEVCELKPGERVVVSPLLKPIIGMKVHLRDDDLARAEVRSPKFGDQRKATGDRQQTTDNETTSEKSKSRKVEKSKSDDVIVCASDSLQIDNRQSTIGNHSKLKSEISDSSFDNRPSVIGNSTFQTRVLASILPHGEH